MSKVRNLANNLDATEASNCGAITVKKPCIPLMLLKLTYIYCLVHVRFDQR